MTSTPTATEPAAAPTDAQPPRGPILPRRPKLDLFLVSFAILFLELACIRWFGSTVVFLTFFTNIVLLATFLGMSVGCLAAGRRHNLINLVVPLLLLSMALACAVLFVYLRFGR